MVTHRFEFLPDYPATFVIRYSTRITRRQHAKNEFFPFIRFIRCATSLFLQFTQKTDGTIYGLFLDPLIHESINDHCRIKYSDSLPHEIP